MNRNILKAIAAFTMTLDHVAVHLVPATYFSNGLPTEHTILRVLGRIAFVLFAYMIAEGFFKTSNIKKYFLRLLVFAVAIEAFVLIAAIFTNDYEYVLTVNIFWTLVFGLGGLWLFRSDKIWIRLLAVPLVFIAEYLNLSYGAYGVLAIYVFGLYRNPISQFLFFIGLNLLFIEFPIYSLGDMSSFAKFTGIMNIQWFSLLAFIFIFLYNGQKGKLNTKWFFYIFYPGHFLIIYGIKLLIG